MKPVIGEPEHRFRQRKRPVLRTSHVGLEGEFGFWLALAPLSLLLPLGVFVLLLQDLPGDFSNRMSEEAFRHARGFKVG
jgi:hypothetical protein